MDAAVVIESFDRVHSDEPCGAQNQGEERRCDEYLKEHEARAALLSLHNNPLRVEQEVRTRHRKERVVVH